MERHCALMGCGSIAVAALVLLAAWAPPAAGEAIRTSAMGSCSIALEDSDNEINPYDYGRNPAFLGSAFERSLTRYIFLLSEQRGGLKRPYDPRSLNTLSMRFEGRVRLSERQAVSGSFSYDRLRQGEQYRSLELDQYNDPFYLMDSTTADFTYWGPTMSADYSLRLSSKVSVGAGFDYNISTGLKDYFTRPQVEHNDARLNIGLLLRPRDEWQVGFVARPVRLQNRTSFDGSNENKDLIIQRSYGDSIYDIRSFSTATLTEVMNGVEFALQNFVTTDRVKIGAIFSYDIAENEIETKASPPDRLCYWQDEAIDFKLLARYAPEGLPLVIGVSGRSMNRDGWARRPRYDRVILFDNPIQLRSVGAGASYTIASTGLTMAADYVLNSYDIGASDYGANDFRRQEFTQNIGRLGVEYAAYNVYSVRGGVEVTDYIADRWLRQPINTDRYRFTCGGSYAWRLWRIDGQFVYGFDTQSQTDEERNNVGGTIWLTHLE